MKSSEPRERESRRRKWGRIALHVAVVVAAVVALRAWQQRGTASGPAPELEAPGLAGETLRVPASGERPVLVHFWATWCGVCKAMDGNVADLVGEHEVITVASWSGGPGAVKAHLAEQEVSMPVVLDPDGRLAETYGVNALPTSFVVGPDGTIRHTEVGYTTELGLRARLWLAGL